MSFGIRRPNSLVAFRATQRNRATQSLAIQEIVAPTTINYTRIIEEERGNNPTIHDRIPFPGVKYDVYDNINNFSLSYYKDKNTETEVKLEAGSYNFNDGSGISTNRESLAPLKWLQEGAPGNNGNNAIVRFYPKCFDIAAEFSIKIEAGATLTELLCFEYNPETYALEDFSRSIGGMGDFIHTGGSINCIVSKFNQFNVLEPRVTGCILDPASSLNKLEPLQYCGKISLDFSRLNSNVQDQAHEVEITSATPTELARYKIKIPLLLKISVFVTYMFLTTT